MKFTVRVLGLELLTIEASTDEAETTEGEELAGGTLDSRPIGFTGSFGDQRWESGVEQ